MKWYKVKREALLINFKENEFFSRFFFFINIMVLSSNLINFIQTLNLNKKHMLYNTISLIQSTKINFFLNLYLWPYLYFGRILLSIELHIQFLKFL